MTKEPRTPFSRPFSSSPLKKAVALAATSLLLLTACSSQEASSIKDASNILQNVEVNLNNAAEVSDVHSTVVAFDASSGKSSSDEQDFALRDVVNDLPIRITTRYTTDDGSGVNLDDLEGYTGTVNINISVENLTVKPEKLAYDVDGQQKQQNSLIGTPLSVAASAAFKDVEPQQIFSEATTGEPGTNGIVSSNEQGDTVVQWAKILAGPESGSSTTFTAKLKVEDFSVPQFTIAAHPGLSNDLTASGAVSSSFSSAQNSELELMQSTVEIVTEANQALADAGETISEVRDNLNSSSESLKTSTVEELQQSSGRLTERLENLQQKLGELKTNLGESTEGSQSELVNQMQQTVDSLERFLGTQGENIPAPQVNSETCHVNIAQPQNGATVYSNMVQLSGVLDAYSQANVDCRDQMIEVANSLLGPEEPNAENCKDSQSASCSIYNSQVVLTATLLSSAAQSEQLIESLNPGALSQVSADMEAIYAAMDSLQQQIDALDETPEPPAPSETPTETPAPTEEPTPTEEPSSSPTTPAPTATISPTETPTPEETKPTKNQETIAEIRKSLDLLDESTGASNADIKALEDLLVTLHQTAGEALAELQGSENAAAGSMLSQNDELAQQLCLLSDGGTAAAGKLSQEEIDNLRSYLTDQPCTTTSTPQPVEPAEGETPGAHENSPAAGSAPKVLPRTSAGYEASMQERLKKQVSLWNEILENTNVESENSEAAKNLDSLKGNAQAVSDQIKKIRESLDKVGSEIEGELGSTPSPSPTTADPSETFEPMNPEPSESETSSPEPTTPAPSEPGTPEPTTDPDIKAIKEAAPALKQRIDDLSASLDELGENQEELNAAISEMLENAPAENAEEISRIMSEQSRNISNQRSEGEQAITELFSQQVTALSGTSDSVSRSAENLLDEEGAKLNAAAEKQVEETDARTQAALERIQASHDLATEDVRGASTLLTSELEKIMLDVGDTSVQGSGLLGTLTNNANNADSADYQLSLARQNAEKYSHLREEDMSAIRLKQAQYKATLEALEGIPAFHIDVPSGATVKTIYTFTVGGEQK